MRIAVVADSTYPFEVGGKEKRIYKIAVHLVNAGHQVDVYTMAASSSGRQSAVITEGIRFRFISRRFSQYRKGQRSIRQALRFGLATLKLVREPFDILDVDQIPFVPVWTMSLICALRRKPMVVTWHEYWSREYWREHFGMPGVLLYNLQRITARMPTHLVAVSAETQMRLERIARERQDVHLIPNAVDMDVVRTASPARAGSDIIYVGRLQQHKKVHLLLEAVHLLRAQMPSLRCLVVGTGPELHHLRDYAARLGLNGNVTFLTDRKTEHEIFALMKASRVLVLPSDREGSSLVTIEAIACGLPVVTSDCPNNNARSLIESPRQGTVVQSDQADFARAIHAWLTAAPSNQRVSNALQYGWDQAASAALAAYCEALLGDGPS